MDQLTRTTQSDKMAEDDSKDDAPSGVFVTKGMQLSISEFFLSMNPDGTIEAGPMEISVGLDMCPHWREISLDHLIAAKQAHDAVMAAHAEGPDEQKAEPMHMEFRAGMQSIVACCTALDALYGNLKDRVEIPEELVKTWREQRTARHKQIAEVTRRAFKLDNKFVGALKPFLKDASRFRDMAVHPKGGTHRPILHPDLNIITEWRFAAFRYKNAYNLLESCLTVQEALNQTDGEQLKKSIATYNAQLRDRLLSVRSRWQAHFGALREPHEPGPPA